MNKKQTEDQIECLSLRAFQIPKHQKDVSKYVLSGPVGTITEGLKWSELWGFFFASVCRDQERNTDHNTVKVCCLCRRVESFKSASFFCSWSSSLQTGCCSERSLQGRGRPLLRMVLSAEQSDERLNDKSKSFTVCLQTHKVHNMWEKKMRNVMKKV